MNKKLKKSSRLVRKLWIPAVALAGVLFLSGCSSSAKGGNKSNSSSSSSTVVSSSSSSSSLSSSTSSSSTAQSVSISANTDPSTISPDQMLAYVVNSLGYNNKVDFNSFNIGTASTGTYAVQPSPLSAMYYDYGIMLAEPYNGEFAMFPLFHSKGEGNLPIKGAWYTTDDTGHWIEITSMGQIPKP